MARFPLWAEALELCLRCLLYSRPWTALLVLAWTMLRPLGWFLAHLRIR